MKILVLNLDGAAPESLLEDERLTTLRGLMEAGSYGPLTGAIPPGPIPSGMSLATGRDPGGLGLYGLLQRPDRRYDAFENVGSWSTDAPTIWDQAAQAEKRAILVGVCPTAPPIPVQGLSISGFLTPAGRDVYTYPPELAATIEGLVGPYPTDLSPPVGADRAALRDHVLDVSRKQFHVVRHLIANEPWDYFQFNEPGLRFIQQEFWIDHDPGRPGHVPDGPFVDVVRDYYLHLDQEIATVLESLTEDALVLVVSTHGARPAEGGFAINEWLAREGFLKLREAPEVPGPLAKQPVDWGATTAWARGGPCALVHLNVQGRDPEGTIAADAYEAVRDDLTARLEAAADPDGRPLGLTVHKPESLYREVRGVAPDLIVEIGDGSRHAVGFLGVNSLLLDAEAHDPIRCHPCRRGAFILAGSRLPAFGAIEGVDLLDVAPTLLELAELPPLPDAHGRNFLEGREPADPDAGPADPDDEELLRDRLRGLGYIG